MKTKENRPEQLGSGRFLITYLIEIKLLSIFLLTENSDSGNVNRSLSQIARKLEALATSQHIVNDNLLCVRQQSVVPDVCIEVCASVLERPLETIVKAIVEATLCVGVVRVEAEGCDGNLVTLLQRLIEQHLNIIVEVLFLLLDCNMSNSLLTTVNTKRSVSRKK